MTRNAVPTLEELAVCFQYIDELCNAIGLTVVRLDASSECRLKLHIVGSSREWILEVDCSWPKATELPKVYLCQHSELLAHVGYQGSVCINDAHGLSIDQSRQGDTVAYSVVAAIRLLQLSAADATKGCLEFFNELEGYWSGLPNIVFARTCAEVDSRDRFITSFIDHRAKNPLWYFIERGGGPPPEFQVKKLSAMHSLYVALDITVPPPLPGCELNSIYIEEIVAAFNPTQKILWRQLTSNTAKTKRKLVSILVSMPRDAGGKSIIGLSFYVRGGRIDTSGVVTPLVVLRHTTTYMRERGGATSGVESKHIVVIGCGSIGSEVADALASSGVGYLTLIDPEMMTEDNVFRHVLGRKWIGHFKVHALSEELLNKYPGIQVNCVVATAQTWFAEHGLSRVDGILFALGLPTLERSFSKHIRASGLTIPIVHTWLEPLDLGGHSLFFSSTGDGCLECLYRDEDGTNSLIPRTAFLAPGQSITKNLTGCVSIFVPYGAIQSRRTALLAAEQMLRAFGGAIAPAYSFWVGEGIAANTQGLTTTPWWSRAKLVPHMDATKKIFGITCRHCRSPI